MTLQILNLDCIIIYEGLKFNVKNSYNFLSDYITLNLDNSYLII